MADVSTNNDRKVKTPLGKRAAGIGWLGRCVWRKGKRIGRPRTRETAKSRGIRRAKGPGDTGKNGHEGGKIMTAVSARARADDVCRRSNTRGRGSWRTTIVYNNYASTRYTADVSGKIHTPSSRPQPSGKSNRPLSSHWRDTITRCAPVPSRPHFKWSIRPNPFRKLTNTVRVHWHVVYGVTRRTDRGACAPSSSRRRNFESYL